MKLNILECNLCGDKIFSRANHDYRYCSCENIFVDGGNYFPDDEIFSFYRYGGKGNTFKHGTVELEVTEKELYDDWNKSTDAYGIIKCMKPHHKDKVC